MVVLVFIPSTEEAEAASGLQSEFKARLSKTTTKIQCIIMSLVAANTL